jgi:hypothetical protein
MYPFGGKVSTELKSSHNFSRKTEFQQRRTAK